MAAGIVYALGAFAVGFLFGTFRVLVLEPWLGPPAAVALELPLMLAVSWLLARAIVRRLGLDDRGSRIRMGVAGIGVLMALEVVLGLLFGRPLMDQLADYATVRGMLTLVGQIGFALIPLIV